MARDRALRFAWQTTHCGKAWEAPVPPLFRLLAWAADEGDGFFSSVDIDGMDLSLYATKGEPVATKEEAMKLAEAALDGWCSKLKAVLSMFHGA